MDALNLRSVTVHNLRQIARWWGMPGRSTLRKPELVQRLNRMWASATLAPAIAAFCARRAAALRIAKCWRAASARSPPAACINDTDPVTQEDVKDIEHPVVLVEGPSRKYCVLDAVALGDSILATGKAVNWVTNTPLSPAEIWRVDRIRARACPAAPGVAANLAHAQQQAADAAARANIGQAMCAELSDAWSPLNDAPYSVTPDDTLRTLRRHVARYVLCLSELRQFDTCMADDAHEAHMQSLAKSETCHPSLAGDACITKHLRMALNDMLRWHPADVAAELRHMRQLEAADATSARGAPDPTTARVPRGRPRRRQRRMMLNPLVVTPDNADARFDWAALTSPVAGVEGNSADPLSQEEASSPLFTARPRIPFPPAAGALFSAVLDAISDDGPRSPV